MCMLHPPPHMHTAQWEGVSPTFQSDGNTSENSHRILTQHQTCAARFHRPVLQEEMDLPQPTQNRDSVVSVRELRHTLMT